MITIIYCHSYPMSMPLSLIELEHKIQPFLEKGQQEPIRIDEQGLQYVVKFERREKGRAWREWLSALGCLVLFQIKVNPRTLRAGGIHHEAYRLQQLKALGLHVPKLYLQQPTYIVMADEGESVAHILKRQGKAEPVLLYAIIDELIALHKAGQWHGGAQARNLTYNTAGKIYRIDFEENTGNAMPLALAQAYDVLLCFLSLIRHISPDQHLGHALLSHYLHGVDIANNPALLHRLQQINRYLRLVRWLRGPSRLVFFSRLLEHCLGTHLST